MKRYIHIIICLLPLISQAQMRQDSAATILPEVVIVSKEGQELKKIPSSVSIISANRIENERIESIRGLSAGVPNLFIPDYGSKYTSAVYIRGVGSRMGNSAIGMYVDNVPYIDKTSFDFDFFDLSRIEILRGPQGTLYGRNSMGGLINIYTLSPWDYQGTRVKLSAGSHGQLQTKISHYAKLSDRFALAIGGNYSATGGFYKNQNPVYSPKIYNAASLIFPSHYGKSNVGAMQSASLRLNLGWRPTERLSLNLVSNYEFADQNGYAYGKYNFATNLPDTINYNDVTYYRRSVSNNSLRVEYDADKFKISSNTGVQSLADSMLLDNDFSPESMFTLYQGQKLYALNEEIVIRSNGTGNFQWLGGLSGFYQNMKTDSEVAFKKDGIAMIVDNIKNSGMPLPLTITDERFPVLGDYRTENSGLAAFSQLSYNNLLISGLSVSAGLRLDYEKISLKHFNNSTFNYSVQTRPMIPPVNGTKNDTIKGHENMNFTQLLPKFALKYEKGGNMVYASVSKGYKAGGYNLQMFSDLMGNKMRVFRPTPNTRIDSAISFKPEYSWNYEIGGKLSFSRNGTNFINAGLTLFLLNIRDQQIAEFAPNGQGRMIKNAGEAESKGIEANITIYPVNTLRIGVNFGYTDSRFTKYTEQAANNDIIDYSGKYVPFVPRTTVSVTADYTLNFTNSFIDRLSFGAQYSGAGKIYWNETNDVAQKYYSLLNARISLEKGIATLCIRGNNLTATDYTTFYFKTFGKSFGQLGKPVHFAVDLSLKF